MKITDAIIFEYLKNQNYKEEVENWLKQNSKNEEYFTKIKKLFEIANLLEFQEDFDVEEGWENFKKQIEIPKPTTHRRINIAAIAIAASLAAFIVLLWLFLKKDNVYTIENYTSQEYLDTLPDKSIIELQPNSEINFKITKNYRQVDLEGIATFKVQKNIYKPFKVNTKYAQIEVLGTIFQINTRLNNEKMSVYVEEGSVKILTKSDSATLYYSQKAEIDKKTGKIQIQYAENEKINKIFKISKILIFSNTPFYKVVDSIAKHYNIITKFPEKIREKTITAKFIDENIETIAEVISSTLSLHYEIKKDTLIFRINEN